MKYILLAIALGAALTNVVLAQTVATPDFSGTWKLNLAKSKLDKNSTFRLCPSQGPEWPKGVPANTAAALGRRRRCCRT
jgi:hypothetical protein